MAKIVTIDLSNSQVRAALKLLHASGYNDGLRRAMGRQEEGWLKAMDAVMELLPSLQVPSNGK